MSEVPKTVWVTKYALTSGVQQFEAVASRHTADMITVPRDHGAPGWTLDQHFHGKDWHPTREAALARANEMKVAKIASLKRQIERLESLEF